MAKATPKPGTPPSAAVPDGARAVAAAAAQIDLALQEAEHPVTQLGANIIRMTEELEALRAGVGQLERVSSEPEIENRLHERIARLQMELTSAVQQLQYADRMFQHLSHIRDFTADLAALIATGELDDAVAGECASRAAATYDALRKRLHGRLLSDVQREQLDANMPPKGGKAPEPRERAALGSIELF